MRPERVVFVLLVFAASLTALDDPDISSTSCRSLGGSCYADPCSGYADCTAVDQAHCENLAYFCCSGTCTPPTSSPTASATPTVTPTSTPTKTPTSTPTATPAPPECSPEGLKRACAVGACSGSQVCVGGSWSTCLKDVLCCGVECDDGNASTVDSCLAGTCLHQNAAGSNAGTPIPTPLSTPPPATAPTVYRNPAEIKLALGQLPSNADADQMRAEAERALELEQQGRYEEAREAWESLDARLNSLLAKQQESTLAYYYLLAGVTGAALLAIALYFALGHRKTAPMPRKDIEHRVKEIELERTELIKKFMKREVDYATYSRMNGELDKELIGLQARLGEKK